MISCRCYNCWSRRAFRKLPWDHVRKPRCRNCGRNDKWLVDHYRMGKEHEQRKRNTCRCDGYWFPHQKGLGECFYSETKQDEDAPPDWTDEEFAKLVAEIPE